MSNVNNLNGVPNFGHGEEVVVPKAEELPAIDEVSLPVETDESVFKPHKSKVKSAKK